MSGKIISMNSPFVRISWNKYEIVLLIDTYNSVKSGIVSKKEAISGLAERLRYGITRRGIEVNEKYRNENGITLQLSYIEICMTNGEKGRENPSKMFIEVSDLYQNNPEDFEILLNQAKELYPIPNAKSVLFVEEMPVLVYEENAENNLFIIEIEKILKNHFHKGFRLSSSIEIKRLKDLYAKEYNKKLDIDNDVLVDKIKSCGFINGQRLFVPEQIMSDDQRANIKTYIENTFKTRRPYVFYTTIIDEFHELLFDSGITNEEMLCQYLRHFYKTEWMFNDSFIKTNDTDILDFEKEVVSFIKDQGGLVSEEEVVNGMPYLPSELVKKLFSNRNQNLVSAGRNLRFHICNFVVSDDELNSIVQIIENSLEKYDYAIAEELINDMRKLLPNIFSNNESISELGIRNAIGLLLKNRYNFNNGVICHLDDNYTAKDILQRFAKHHECFNIDEIDNLAKSLSTIVNYHLSDLYNYCIRVDKDTFVNDSNVCFYTDAIDATLDRLVNNIKVGEVDESFIPLKKITDFSLFPECSYPWNQRLLESYLIHQEKNEKKSRYRLLYNRYLNKNNISGVVILIQKNVENYDDVIYFNYILTIGALIGVLKNGVKIEKNSVLDYLVNEGFIVQRRYEQIEEVLTSLKKIINNKKN